jgi:hypothetical protein
MEAADAVIMANYPQNGGAAAIADTLLGKLSPAGRLPVTWHKNWNCSIEPDPKNPGRTTGRCAIMPAKLLGTDLTYRYGGSDNTLWPFGYVSASKQASKPASRLYARYAHGPIDYLYCELHHNRPISY